MNDPYLYELFPFHAPIIRHFCLVRELFRNIALHFASLRNPAFGGRSVGGNARFGRSCKSCFSFIGGKARVVKRLNFATANKSDAAATEARAGHTSADHTWAPQRGFDHGV